MKKNSPPKKLSKKADSKELSSDEVEKEIDCKRVFKHGFGSITLIKSDDSAPVYATSKLCMYFWST